MCEKDIFLKSVFGDELEIARFQVCVCVHIIYRDRMTGGRKRDERERQTGTRHHARN